MVVLKPRDLTTVGKNWNYVSGCCSKQKELVGTYLVEGGRAQVHVLHEDQEIEPWVAQSLHEAGLCALALCESDGIALDAIVRELALLWSQPAGSQGRIRKDEDANDRNTDGDNT